MKPFFHFGITLICLFSMASNAANPQEKSSNVVVELNGSIVNFPFNWVQVGDSEKPILLAIHGTPGNWGTWKTLMRESDLLDHYQIWAIDRPGWGGSVHPDFPVLPSMSDQANIIGNWFEMNRPMDKPVVVLGHSWGGPVVAQLAADFPNMVNAALFVASPFDPELSKPRWYHRWAKTYLVGWLIGKDMRKSNQEMLPLSEELALLAPQLAKIQVPTAIIQGHKDRLVDKDNAVFLAEGLVNSQDELIQYPKKGHFIPFSSPELITKAALNICKELMKPELALTELQ